MTQLMHVTVFTFLGTAGQTADHSAGPAVVADVDADVELAQVLPAIT